MPKSITQLAYNITVVNFVGLKISVREFTYIHELKKAMSTKYSINVNIWYTHRGNRKDSTTTWHN